MIEIWDDAHQGSDQAAAELHNIRAAAEQHTLHCEVTDLPHATKSLRQAEPPQERSISTVFTDPPAAASALCEPPSEPQHVCLPDSESDQATVTAAAAGTVFYCYNIRFKLNNSNRVKYCERLLVTEAVQVKPAHRLL
eukprot:g8583.t1